MDVAAASIDYNLARAQFDAGYAVANKAMEATEAQAEQLLQMLSQTPSFGHKLDVRV